MAKEYIDDLCKFSVVIRPEQVHQRINKLALDYFLPLADKALRNAIADVKGIKVPSPEQSQQGVEMLYKCCNLMVGKGLLILSVPFAADFGRDDQSR